MNDPKLKARFVRQLCQLLGYRIPTDWTDEQVLQFIEHLATQQGDPRVLH